MLLIVRYAPPHVNPRPIPNPSQPQSRPNQVAAAPEDVWDDSDDDAGSFPRTRIPVTAVLGSPDDPALRPRSLVSRGANVGGNRDFTVYGETSLDPVDTAAT